MEFMSRTLVTEPKNKGGRPSQGKSSGAFKFRVTASLRDKLEAEAEAIGRPVSEVIERRVEASFEITADPIKQIALRLIAERWNLIDAVLQGRSVDDPMIYARSASKAVEDALRIGSEPSLLRALSGRNASSFYRDAVSGQEPGSATAIETLEDKARESLEDRTIFRAVMDDPEG